MSVGDVTSTCDSCRKREPNNARTASGTPVPWGWQVRVSADENVHTLYVYCEACCSKMYKPTPNKSPAPEEP